MNSARINRRENASVFIVSFCAAFVLSAVVHLIPFFTTSFFYGKDGSENEM